MSFKIEIGIAIAISISNEDRDRDRDLNFGDRGLALFLGGAQSNVSKNQDKFVFNNIGVAV